MKAKLSYLYLGERFPEYNGEAVVVKEIAQKADLSYNLLKNRMGIKKKRSEGCSSVWISDVDLQPKKKDAKPKKKRSLTEEEKIQRLSNEWLKRKWI